MCKYPLATLITTGENGPFISHLPLIVEDEKDGLWLYGHLARANPHVRSLDRAEVYAIFHGPNAYVTPLWYAENDVPTWNYAVVHVQGECEMIPDRQGIEVCLRKLSAHMERGERKWEFWVPEDLAGNLEKRISAFKIKVESLQAKFKLGQQRSAEDRKGVEAGLRAGGGGFGAELADLSEAWFK